MRLESYSTLFTSFCRNQIRGLRTQHQKDIGKLKEILKNPSELLYKEENEETFLKPIGFVSTWHQTKNGTPRQGTIAKLASGYIDLQRANEFHPGLENPGYALEGNGFLSHMKT